MSDKDFADEMFGTPEPVEEALSEGLEPHTEETTTEPEDQEDSYSEEELEPQHSEEDAHTDSEEPKKGHRVPVAVLRAERDKHKAQLELERSQKQALEDRIKFFEEQNKRLQPNQAPAYRPTPQDDPVGYQEARFRELAERQTNMELTVQAQLAAQSYGAETVQQAAQWAADRLEASPHLQAIWNNPTINKVDAFVREYQKEQLVNQYQSNPDEFIKAEYAKRFGQTDTPITESKPRAKTMSDGINSAPSKGSIESTPLIEDPIGDLFDPKPRRK